MKDRAFKLDERDLSNFRKVCTILYIITIYALMGVLVYRQFVLRQPHQEWDDGLPEETQTQMLAKIPSRRNSQACGRFLQHQRGHDRKSNGPE